MSNALIALPKILPKTMPFPDGFAVDAVLCAIVGFTGGVILAFTG